MSVHDSAGPRIVVIGGTSEIALAIVRALALAAPREVALLGRDAAGLEAAAASLRAAGCTQVAAIGLEGEDGADREAPLAAAFARLGGADIVILAIGMLGERGGLPAELAGAVEVLRVNVVLSGSLLLAAAGLLRAQRSGTLVVLSSVAGERVRRSNLVYGAAKAGLDGLARGLADELHPDGVRVLVVRPGFVRTRMTRGLDAPPFATDPGGVARAVLRGLERGNAIVWAPRALRWVMVIYRALPRALARRMPL